GAGCNEDDARRCKDLPEPFRLVPERGLVNHRSDWSSFVGDAGHGLMGRLLGNIDVSSGRVEIAPALFVADEQAERRVLERAAKALLFFLERLRFGRLLKLHASSLEPAPHNS